MELELTSADGQHWQGSIDDLNAGLAPEWVYA